MPLPDKIDRSFVASEICRRKKQFPKLHKLIQTKSGKDKVFVNVVKILLTFKVKTSNELFEGLESRTKKKRLDLLEKEFNAAFPK